MRTSIFAVGLFVAGGCSPSDTRVTERDTATAAIAESAQSAVASPTGTASSMLPPPAAGQWDVTARGIGRINAGMSLDEARILLGDDLIVPAKLEECDWVRVRNAPPRLLVMVEQGKISRIDVDSGTAIATAAGARIGDTEERIKSLYPGQVTVQPHKYTDGHYLVVTPADAADKDFRIVFETDGNKVTRYRSGKIHSVQYVEGCS